MEHKPTQMQQTTSTNQLPLPADFLLDPSFSSVFPPPSPFSLPPSFLASYDTNSLLSSDFPLSDSSDNDSLSSIPSPLPLTPSPTLDLSSHVYSLPAVSAGPQATTATPATVPLPPVVVEVKKKQSSKKRKNNSKEIQVAAEVRVSKEELGELLNQQAEKQKKLARKAELARQSRRKKKARLVDLEHQVSDLQAQLAKAREEAKQLSAKNALLTAQASKIAHDKEKPTDKMVADLLSVATKEETQQSDGTMNQVLNELATAFQSQSALMEMNLQTLEQSILPCLPLQFLDWTMMQKDRFVEDENSVFWTIFRDEMKATPQQIKQLLDLRKNIQLQQTAKVKDQTLVETLKDFRKLLVDRGRLRQSESFEQLRSIFTPKQMAAYLKWVNLYGPVLVKVPVP